MKRLPQICAALLTLLLTGLGSAPATAQDMAGVTRLVPSTDRVVVPLGQQVPFSVSAVDASGESIDVPLRVVGPRSAVRVGDGFVEGLAQDIVRGEVEPNFGF